MNRAATTRDVPPSYQGDAQRIPARKTAIRFRIVEKPLAIGGSRGRNLILRLHLDERRLREAESCL
jgi:hypothetical protein